MTSGDQSGTGGERRRGVFLALYGIIAVIVLLQTTVNAISLNHDDPNTPVWKHFTWEWTSAALTIPLIAAIPWLLHFAPPGPGRWLRFVMVHVPALAVFSAVHVGGFTLLRKLIYLIVGARPYNYWQPLSELPKDAMTYGIAAVLFWGAGWLTDRWERADHGRDAPAPTFDIRDGANLIRARVADIVAASSAGNYVEMHLVDGRKPLLRGTLASVEAALKPHGFVRTHRSWLINPLRVRGLSAEGSGDFRVELDGGGEAPLSRRFPQALEALRSPEASA